MTKLGCPNLERISSIFYSIKACPRLSRPLENLQSTRIFVSLGLQATQKPCTSVRQSLVVEIDRVLRCQYHPQGERAGLFEAGSTSDLGRRICSRWEVTEISSCKDGSRLDVPGCVRTQASTRSKGRGEEHPLMSGGASRQGPKPGFPVRVLEQVPNIERHRPPASRRNPAEASRLFSFQSRRGESIFCPGKTSRRPSPPTFLKKRGLHRMKSNSPCRGSCPCAMPDQGHLKAECARGSHWIGRDSQEREKPGERLDAIRSRYNSVWLTRACGGASNERRTVSGSPAVLPGV